MAIQPLIRHDHPVVKTIFCTGTPYEIGLQHGLAAAKEIHANITTYTNFFQETAQITWSTARGRAITHFIQTLEAAYPQILEEMRGIADGAGRGLTMEDILTLNVRSEIALTNYADGCTSISQEGKAGEMFLAQNWDWLEELHEGMVLMDISPSNAGVRLKFLGEGGIVGKIGMNDAGFGLCMNALRSGALDGRKLPVHIMSRRLLQYATSVEDAIVIIQKFGLASTTNYMFADKRGEHLDMECSPKGNAFILPEHGFVAHTNHLYAAGKPAGLVDHPAANSFSRLARIQELTQLDLEEKKPTSYASLRKRLSDEQGMPFSICRDRPPGTLGMERMTTLASIMMELKSGSGRVLIGRPCDNLPVIEWSFKN